MKIKFLTNSIVYLGMSYLNLSFFLLKDYHERFGKAKDVEWLPADLILLDPTPEVIHSVCQQAPDILALAIYTWNEDIQHDIAKKTREMRPGTIIIMGGPQLTAHKDPDFFQKHPYVDYVVYGDGEKAFTDIIDYHSGAVDTRDHWANTVWNDSGTWRIFPYQRFAEDAFTGVSPYVSQRESIQQHIGLLEHRGITRRQMIAGVEFARGCMYNCSFCDWSQNLTKKVKRRKSPWKDVIDLFYELDIAIRETDANFGQWDEDIEIYDYAASRYDPNRNFKFVTFNTPKLRKNVSEYLITRNVQVYGAPQTISLQDLNPDVLQKMDRPSASWEDHVEMIKRIKSALGQQFDHKIKVDIIMGAAGQSYDSACDTLYRIARDTEVVQFRLFHWALLPNAPAADPLYQKLHKLTWKPAYESYVPWNLPSATTMESYYQSVADKSSRHLLHRIDTIWSTATMTFVDILAVEFLADELRFRSASSRNYLFENLDKIFPKAKSRARIRAQRQFEIMEPLIEKYGFVILGLWNPYEKTISLASDWGGSRR